MAQQILFDNYTEMYFIRISDGGGNIIGFVGPRNQALINVTDDFGATVTVLRVGDASTAWGPDFVPFPRNYVRVIGDATNAGINSTELAVLPGGGAWPEVDTETLEAGFWWVFTLGLFVLILWAVRQMKSMNFNQP